MNLLKFKNKQALEKRLHDLAHPNPTRDWFALLVLSLIVLAAIVTWNVWAFNTVANGGVINTSISSNQAVFNQSSLNTIHTIFSARNAEQAKYVSGQYHFTDPSQ